MIGVVLLDKAGEEIFSAQKHQKGALPQQGGRFLELQKKVNAIDLSGVKYKLLSPRKNLGWTLKYAEIVERKYRQFLVLMGLHSESPVVPSKDVDEFWHMHILFTEKYAQDCLKTFGRFIHHEPYLGGDDDQMGVYQEETSKLYFQMFGEELCEEGEVRQKAVCSRCSVGNKQ